VQLSFYLTIRLKAGKSSPQPLATAIDEKGRNSPDRQILLSNMAEIILRADFLRYYSATNNK
jgi:hypothetical protein